MTWQVLSPVPPERAPEVRSLLAHTWWASERTEADVLALLAGSSATVGLVDAGSGRLVGFTRVIGDGRFLALILDVVTHPDIRGTGAGAALMEAVLALPQVSDVDSVELVCQPDLVAFYERFGFTDRVGTSRLMRRTANPKLTS